MSQNIQTELDAILNGAAVASLDDRAFLRVTGSDATRWLNGMVTNSVQALAPGEGCYNFLLNAQGRILGDCTIYREIDAPNRPYLLETTATQVEAIQQAPRPLHHHGRRRAHAGLHRTRPRSSSSALKHPRG